MSQRWIAAIVAAACTSAAAQTFPDKAVRIVVPYPPGGSTDLVARILGEGATELLGQSIIIDNRSGAGGIVGTVAVARAAPDGYTLVACTVGTCAIVPSLVKNTGYDLAKDFVPVILFGGVANIFVVTPTFPPKSIKELVALARARPGEIVFGSGGVGNSPHMTVELLKYRTKIDMVHVPYKGSGPALIDTAGGQVQMMVENEPAIVAHIKSGRLRGLAGTGPRRSAALGDQGEQHHRRIASRRACSPASCNPIFAFQAEFSERRHRSPVQIYSSTSAVLRVSPPCRRVRLICTQPRFPGCCLELHFNYAKEHHHATSHRSIESIPRSH